MKIAIIDDEEKDREEVKDALIPYLHTLDFKTELCEYKSAEEFLEHFEKDEFDICFMDIYLKEMDGMTAARYIAKKTPTVLLSFSQPALTIWRRVTMSGPGVIL